MKKWNLVALFFLITSFTQASSYFSANNLGDPSSRSGVYSMGMGNSGMAYFDRFNVHLLNHSLTAGIDSTQIYASAIGDYLTLKDNNSSGLHISYSIPAFRFLIPVKGGLKIGIQYNTLYHNNINVDLSETSIPGDTITYKSQIEKFGSLNTGELFFSYSLKKRIFLGLSFMSYFGSNEWKRTKTFDDSYFNGFFGKRISEYSGYNLLFSSTYFINSKASFAFYYSPEKEITNHEKFQTNYHEEFSSVKKKFHLGQRLGIGLSYRVKENIAANLDVNFEDEITDDNYIQTSSRFLQIGGGIEKIGNIDFLASFWERNSYRTGFYYRECGVKDLSGNEISELALTLGATIPLKSFSNAFLFSLQYCRRGDIDENGASENVIRISFGFSGLELWGKKRGYY